MSDYIQDRQNRYDSAAENIGHYVDNALSPDKFEIDRFTVLVGWQCGFEQMFVAVRSYLPDHLLSEEEAEELAIDLLDEIEWFAGESKPADFIYTHTDLAHNSKEWRVQDISNAKYTGTLQTDNGETFEVVAMPNAYVFGSACNTGLLQSGYMIKDSDQNETLGDLLDNLNVFYRDGREYATGIVCNERM